MSDEKKPAKLKKKPEPKAEPQSTLQVHGFAPGFEIDCVRHAVAIIRGGEWTRETRMQLVIEVSWFAGCGAAMFAESDVLAADGLPFDPTTSTNNALLQICEANLPAGDSATLSPGQWIQIALALFELLKRFN